ncbi:MAG TPA: HAMP domain-containing sensor histidine kinase [Myxococcota bacterium]|nr:HAMP domain-containing sensor histidine kinase [Myxococcota bacterium]
MRRRPSDPVARRLRNFVLLTIFAVAVPSLLLTGFGLIAIDNERAAAMRRIEDLYKPVLGKLADRLNAWLSALPQSSAAALEDLAAFARRETSAPGDRFEKFATESGAVDCFVIGADGRALYPRPEPPLPTWQGYLPDSFSAGQQLEFAERDPSAAVVKYRAALSELTKDDPARCPVLNALARALAGARHDRDALTALDALISACPDHVDHTGYNLALGARLRRLALMRGQDKSRFIKEIEALSVLLGSGLPMLKASSQQAGFAAARALELLGDGARRLQPLAAETLEAISHQADLLSALPGLAAGEARLLTVRAAGRRRLILARGGRELAGCLLLPAGRQSSLAQTLGDMGLSESLQARLRSSEEQCDEDCSGILAAAAYLKTTDLAWKLELLLRDSGSIDALAKSRTRLYFWALLLAVVTLVLGIGRTLQVMIREARLARLKTDFVSSVSHELRTPLTSIRMFTQTLLLGRTRSEAEERDCLETIDRETERLTRLVERILDFSRMEAGRKAFHFKPEEIVGLIDQALASCGPMIEAGGFEIVRSLAAELPAVELDRDAMLEVLINLLSNAVKYSRDERRIEIFAGQVDDGLELGVSDRGSGIERALHKRIFEKFYRVDNRLASEVAGSGLGLSLVRYIVQAHRGEIRVDSSPGRGSTFTIRLPLRHAGAEKKSKRKEEE